MRLIVLCLYCGLVVGELLDANMHEVVRIEELGEDDEGSAHAKQEHTICAVERPGMRAVEGDVLR